MRRTLTQSRWGGGGFAPLQQVDETGEEDQPRPDEAWTARERFRSHVQQALRHASMTSDQYGELEAQPSLQYAGHAPASRPVQDALVSPQYEYHELGEGTYVEYYRPNYNRAPSSLSKDSDVTDVTLVEVEQREKYFLGADIPAVHVVEKPMIRDPPPAPNYKPFALKWVFSLILFLMLAALVGLAQYATQALPNAAQVSVTIEELPGAGQPDLRARGWQGGLHRQLRGLRSLAVPKSLAPGKREEPGDGDDNAVDTATPESLPVTSPATTLVDPTPSAKPPVDSLTTKQEPPELTSPSVLKPSETTAAATPSTTKELVTPTPTETLTEAVPTSTRPSETIPLTSATPTDPTSTEQQATTPEAQPTSETTKVGDADTTDVPETTSDRHETSNTPETPIATTTPRKEEPPSTSTVQTSIPEDTWTNKPGTLTAPTTVLEEEPPRTTPKEELPATTPKEEPPSTTPQEKPPSTLPEQGPPSTNPFTIQTEDTPQSTLASNTPPAPITTPEEPPSTIQTSHPEETPENTLTSNTPPAPITTPEEPPLTIQTSNPEQTPENSLTSNTPPAPITTPKEEPASTSPDAAPPPAHSETNLYTIQTSIPDEAPKGTTPLPVPIPTLPAPPESSAPVKGAPSLPPSPTHTKSITENKPPQGYPTPPKHTGDEKGPGHPGGPTAPTQTESVKGTGGSGAPVVVPTYTENGTTHVGTGPAGGPVVAPTHTESVKRPNETGPAGEPVVAPTHTGSEKNPGATGRPPAVPTQAESGKDTGKADSNKPTNIGHAPGNSSGRPPHATTSYPPQEPTALPLPGGAIITKSMPEAEPLKGPMESNAPDGPDAPDRPTLSMTGPPDVDASHVGPPLLIAPIRTGTEAAPLALETQAKPASEWRETFVIEASTARPIAQPPPSIAKGPDAPAQTTPPPPPTTPHKPWTIMVTIPSPSQRATGSPSVAPIVTVVLPAETRERHLTTTSTATWTTKGLSGKFITKVSEKTLDIVVHMVSQEQLSLQYPTGLDDQVTAVPSTTLTDAHGKPTATLMATKYLKHVTSIYTDLRGVPTSTGTAWILGNIQRKPTTVDGRVSTLTYVEKVVTRVMTDKYGRVLSTVTQTATQTPYFSTYYDDGIATSTQTLWGPVTATSTLIVKPTSGADSHVGSEPVELPSLTSADYFLGLIVPTLLTVILSIPVRIMDQTAKLYQPFHALTGRHGAETKDSLCLRTTGMWGLVGGLKSIFRHHVVLPVTGMMVLASMVLVPISAEATRLVVQGPNCSIVDPSQCLVSLEAFPTLISVVVAILSLMLLLTVVAAYTLWNWTTGVPKPPWSMSEMGRLAANDSFACLLKGMKADKGLITNASAVKALGRRRFQLQYWQSGELWRYGVVVQNDAGSLLPKERKSKNPQKPVAWTSRRKKMPFFALTVGGRLMAFTVMLAFLVLVLVYVSTGGPTGFENFMDGQAFGVRFLFTAIGVLVSLYWWCFFNAIAFLSPYRILLGKSTEEAVRLNPPTNPYSGLWAVCTRRHPDAYLGVVAFTAILADFFPVLSANVPSKVLQASAAHMACTWLATAILGIMVIVLTWSLLLTWPHMPMNPSTVAGAMYYALDPFRFLHGVSDDPKLTGGRSSPV